MIIGRHHKGHALPLTVCGAEVGGGETRYTFRSAGTKEEFLLFMSDTLTVTAASQETMTMMGVSACGSESLGCVSIACLEGEPGGGKTATKWPAVDAW
jgi:hypothetical protein